MQALVALVKYGNKAKQTVAQKKAFTKLYNIAFPELLAEKINKIEDFKDDDPSVLFADKLEYQ